MPKYLVTLSVRNPQRQFRVGDEYPESLNKGDVCELGKGEALTRGQREIADSMKGVLVEPTRENIARIKRELEIENKRPTSFRNGFE